MLKSLFAAKELIAVTGALITTEPKPCSSAGLPFLPFTTKPY
jgi:hypothetical protein